MPNTRIQREGHYAARSAMVITVLYVVIGYGSQIGRVLSRGTASDLSVLLLSLGLATFTSWTYAGLVMRPRNMEIVVSNGLGVFFALALLIAWASLKN
jgi:hypothetical protein